MRPKLLLAGFLLSFLYPFLCFADQSQVSKIVLDNGLTVLIQNLPASEVTSIYACVKTGSATEGRFLGKGISHFVEHMLFKGTARRPVGAIAKEVKSLGGVINADTSYDYTMYTLDVPRKSLEQGLDIISDMLMNSAFDPKEMEKERIVIHGEMRLYNDRPDRVLSDLVFQNVFKRHPYRHPVIGYPDLFDSITRQELYSYYKERYVPNNIILSIAGAVKPGEILPLINKTFKGFKRAVYRERNIAQEPPQEFQRYLEKEYPTDLIRFSLGYEGISILDPDLYALDVLSMALGQGGSSRLYKEIYEKRRLAESISAGNFTPQDRGVFEIEGDMSQDHLNEILTVLKAMITDIQRNGLTQAELDKTKRQVLAAFVFSNQTAPSLASRAAMDEALTGDCNFSRHYVDLVKKVTNEDIKRVANRYLRESRLNVTVLRPRGSSKVISDMETAADQQGIKKIVLPNGLTILLHEDKNVLLDDIKITVKGGTRAENSRLGGIARLTGSVWSKGTRHLSEEAINRAMEQRGGDLSSEASHNTLELHMNVLSEDLDFALNLLEDLVKNPSFSPDAIEQERREMLMALKERGDDIMSFSSRLLLETFYDKNSLHRDPLGSPKSLSQITQKDVAGFYRSLMYSNNMVISVFGNFDYDHVLNMLRAKFGSLNKGNAAFPLSAGDFPNRTKLKEIQMNKEQALLMMAFPAPQWKDPDRFSMDIINTILGGGLGGRLFTKIREELGQAYTTNSQYIPDLDTGTFVLYVLTRKRKIDSVKDIIIKELEALRTRKISEEDLQTAKSYLKGAMLRSLLTNSDLADRASTDELYGLGYDSYKRFNDNIDAVSAEDVQKTARHYLDMTHAAVVVTRPEKNYE